MLARFHLVFKVAALLSLTITVCLPATAQKRSAKKTAQKPAAKAPTELERLRDDYIKATKDYKASVEKLLPIYEKDLQAAEQHAVKSKELFAQGLISKVDLAKSDDAVVIARAKVADVHKQMEGADTQIAQVLVEVETEKQMAKLKRIPKGGMVTTTAFIRFNGAGPWSIAQANTVDAFFRERFGRPLPIAVLGQGAIHNRWRLDHRNAMDLQLNPDGVEGKAVTDFLRSRGIPFSAFRQAIPGTATGPHIHVGLPSHRY
jgi:hypothetical protein